MNVLYMFLQTKVICTVPAEPNYYRTKAAIMEGPNVILPETIHIILCDISVCCPQQFFILMLVRVS